MISIDAIHAYRKAFPLSSCGLLPDDSLTISSEDETRSFLMPSDETEADFLNRIDRSRIAGRNLFFEEWPEQTYESNVRY